MAYFRHNNRIAVIVIFSMIILMLMCICFIMWFRTGEEASVGIFSLAVTLLGTIFIAVELKNGQNVTCSDMLIDLNNYFHDSDRLMKLYEAWIKYRKRKDSDWYAHMPYASFAYTEQYLKGRLYLKDESFATDTVCCDLSCKGKTIKLKSLRFRDVWSIIRLQDEIQKSTDSEIYCPLTREEILESLHLDTVLGAFDEDGELSGVAVLISNRKSSRNIAQDLQKVPERVLTFECPRCGHGRQEGSEEVLNHKQEYVRSYSKEEKFDYTEKKY